MGRFLPDLLKVGEIIAELFLIFFPPTQKCLIEFTQNIRLELFEMLPYFFQKKIAVDTFQAPQSLLHALTLRPTLNNTGDDLPEGVLSEIDQRSHSVIVQVLFPHANTLLHPRFYLALSQHANRKYLAIRIRDRHLKFFM